MACGRTFLAVLVLSGAFIFSASSEQPRLRYDDFMKGVKEDAGEIEKFRNALRNPDANLRVAAMRAMLASGDPVLVRIAAEEGLTSTDQNIRAIALRGWVFAQQTFRIDLTFNFSQSVSARSREEIFGVMKAEGGIDTENKAFIFLSKNQQDLEKSCVFANRTSICLSDTSIVVSGSNGRYGGRLILQPDGTLKGQMIVNRDTASPATATIQPF